MSDNARMRHSGRTDQDERAGVRRQLVSVRHYPTKQPVLKYSFSATCEVCLHCRENIERTVVLDLSRGSNKYTLVIRSLAK